MMGHLLPPPSRHPSYEILIDGACPMCRRTARILHRLDWCRALTFLDADDDVERNAVAPELTREAALAAMHVRARPGQILSGYDAFLRVGRVIPLLWPALLVGALPGIRSVGRLVYRRIAASRTRGGRCTDYFCRPA